MIVLLERGSEAGEPRGRLLDTEAHHLRVRRARPGELVELRDGDGLIGQGRLVAEGSAWTVEIERIETIPAPPALVLAVGAGDRDRFAVIAEKAVELGVTSLVPVLTERTAGVATRLRPAHVERLRRHALEAVKQSGNPWACRVEEPVPLTELLRQPRGGSCWLADAGGAPPPSVLGHDAATVLVGPEGGLTDQERTGAAGAGYHAVAFGPHVLRFETAAIAAAAAVQAARLRGRHG
jgi:16S rRNA (uracil1498-N3)-methyltransferase